MATFHAWQDGLSMFAEFEKLPCNPNFSQISQAFPLGSLLQRVTTRVTRRATVHFLPV